jgi:hypothetical protein
VGDADPEDEGDDVGAPEDGVGVARDAEPLVDLPDPDASGREHEAHGQGQQGQPRERRALHDAQQVAVDLRVSHRVGGAHHRCDGFGGRRRHASCSSWRFTFARYVIDGRVLSMWSA